MSYKSFYFLDIYKQKSIVLAGHLIVFSIRGKSG